MKNKMHSPHVTTELNTGARVPTAISSSGNTRNSCSVSKTLKMFSIS